LDGTGVYLLIDFSSSFGYWLNVFLLLFSGLIMFIAGLGAKFEYDLKRVTALSTLRQLGLMIINIVCVTVSTGALNYVRLFYTVDKLCTFILYS
jgi:NADH:ubiquinone oxidoreductase subunit 5 (subunit L)/multisubunit Na+/H+ antiporter MnhA subunit